MSVMIRVVLDHAQECAGCDTWLRAGWVDPDQHTWRGHRAPIFCTPDCATTTAERNAEITSGWPGSKEHTR